MSARLEAKREEFGSATFHLAAAAAGLGGGGVKTVPPLGLSGPIAASKPSKAELALERWIAYIGLVFLCFAGMVLAWLSLGVYGIYAAYFWAPGGAGAVKTQQITVVVDEFGKFVKMG